MKYFDIFKSIEDVHSQWCSAVTDNEVLLAVYSYEDYSGQAFLIYERNGVLYEVHDAHCSCNGLDNWEPEETSWAALKMRDLSEYGTEVNEYFQNLIKSKTD